MKSLYLSLVLLCFTAGLQAQVQNTELKARIYYQEALKLFNQANFEESLEYVQKAEDLLGGTNPRILVLKVKGLYNVGKFTDAKTQADLFLNSYYTDAADELSSEIMSIYVNIEEAVVKQAEEQKALEKALVNVLADLQHSSKLFEWVSPGSFQMGSTSGYVDERPVHRVEITQGFYIGKYEVTQAQWQAVMGSNPSKFKGNNRPVENVSWEDAQAFISKLNQLDREYTYRLPTEAEWEYAARGGQQSRGYKYAGSNNLGSVAWYDDNSGNQTHEVGSKAPNELGLYDMCGNVWEWCADWYDEDYYRSSPRQDPRGPSRGSLKVVRGGSWGSTSLHSRIALRIRGTPTYKTDGHGFRLLRIKN
jgi:formylglycine-generating enzyme required for sulfatase activity